MPPGGRDRQDPGEGGLRIPALGRNARLGYLYDERTDEISGVSIFSGDIPTEFINQTQTPYLSVEYDLSNTYEQKFKLFKIDASVSANILSGLLKVEGSASYLRDENHSSRDVTGLMLYESHTVAEDLQIHYLSLQSLYNTELLQDKSATHLVTGIKWGGNVVIKCSHTAADDQDLEKVGGKLKVEFEKLKGTFSISGAASVEIDATDKSENTKFNLSIRGDISLPDQFPTTYEEVQNLIKKVPELIRNTNDSKGIPVEFILTPLSSLRKHLKNTAQENVIARKIEESRLNDFVSIYDDISYIERKINDHYDTLNENEICVPPSVRRSIVSLRHNFKTAKMSFTTALKDTLRKVRSGLAPETALADLSTSYQAQEFSSSNVQNKLLDFKESLLKVQLYQQIRRSYPRVTYFGLDGDLEASLWDSKDEVVYILYMKQELKDKEPQLWKENKKIFTDTLYRPFNKLFLLDCDFDSKQYQDVRRTRIEQLVKGVTTIPDVHSVMSRSHEREPLQWKALGRVAELGDLFDARTDTFLQDTSFLKDKYPESIVHVTTQGREDVHDFPSESYPDKFRVLGVEAEQQFSILAQLQPLTRTGHYFQDCHAPQFYKTSPKRSFLHSRHLKSQELKIKEPDLWKHLAVQAVDTGATHFVTKIDYGINSIFSIEDPELEESQSNLSYRSLETVPVKSDGPLRSYVDRLKSNILARTPLDNNELHRVFTVKISSDIQGETSIPHIFTSQSQLRQFLNTKFIPMLSDPEAKGQIPIAYVLYPLSNLVHKLGIISPSISYGTLSNSIENRACPKDIAVICERIHLARQQIQQVDECFREHCQYITDQDLSAFKEIEIEFSETLASYAERIRSTIADFKKCGNEESSRESLSLEALVTEFKSKEFFDSSLRYNELRKLQLIEKKIQFCLQLTDMEINILGRESKSVSFNEIVTRHCEGDTRLYFLYYYPTWPKDHADLWPETFGFFCNLRRRTHPAQKLYVVNCEFSYPHSEQFKKPVIHEYRKGKLTSDNVMDTRLDEEVNLRMNQLMGNFPGSTEPLKDINILLLGETGVGKSTWINGIGNYLTYDTLAEAVKNEVVVLIPSQFTMTNENYEEITIPIGAKDPNEVHVTGQTTTQSPRTYCFKTAHFNIRIIDTPGIGDTRGVDQDKKSFQRIMDHLSHVDVIHGICILLKPNNARLGMAFRFCIQELLTQLHRDAAQNIVFCFTNARSTFYRPGDTFTSLKTLLTNKDVISTQIPLEKKTIYCLDNEAFRFLAAVKAGHNFEEDGQANSSKSWETSVKETARLLNYIQGLKPHPTTNTVTLNTTRQTIIKLAKLLAEVSRTIQVSITIIDDKKKELEGLDYAEQDLRGKLTLKQADLEREELPYPRTVCADPSCTEKIPMHSTSDQKKIYVTNYKQVCHDHCTLDCIGKNELNCVGLMSCKAMSNGKCIHCGHGYEIHMHITYSIRQVLKDVIDVNVQKQLHTTKGRIQATKDFIAKFEKRKCDLQGEQTVINRMTARYAVFLKENSITPYNNDSITYMNYLIELEEAKVKEGGENSTLNKLQEVREVCKQEERILLESLRKTPQEGQVSLDDIQKSFQQLFDLPINGPTFQGFLDTANKSDKMCHREIVCEAPPSKLKALGSLISDGCNFASTKATKAVISGALKKVGL